MFLRMNKRKFLVDQHNIAIAKALSDVISGKITRLIINMPPRYGKTEQAVKGFMAYGLALNPRSKFIHLSYSDSLAVDNSEKTRDIILSDEYKQLFPYVKIAKSSNSKKKWETTEGGGVYATSTGGQITGFGAGEVDVTDKDKVNELLALLDGELAESNKDLSQELDSLLSNDIESFAGAIIIDDPLKPDDAISEVLRERVNERFETTIRSRTNSRNTPIIVIMQRLHEHDLCGYLQEIEPDEWTVLCLPAISTDENGEEKALCERIHTIDELNKKRDIDPHTFDTQYMQNPTPIEGLMYREFRTYDTIPFSKASVKKNYTDTADTGSDYLCSICYDELPEGNFVTDILYTKKPMEYTEPKTAEMLFKNKTAIANIESNNGGRGFARNVEKQLREMGNTSTSINWFTQTENKQVRIFTKSADVNNMTYFPIDWETRFPEFARHLKSFRKEGKNANDDIPDVLSGMCEKRTQYVNIHQSLADLGIY